jgi:hypothetical protein
VKCLRAIQHLDVLTSLLKTCRGPFAATGLFFHVFNVRPFVASFLPLQYSQSFDAYFNRTSALGMFRAGFKKLARLGSVDAEVSRSASWTIDSCPLGLCFFWRRMRAADSAERKEDEDNLPLPSCENHESRENTPKKPALCTSKPWRMACIDI